MKASPTKVRYPGLYKGRVVQRTDPQRLGRLRVSVEGLHTGISVENLPWAWPCTPMISKKGGMFGVPPLDEYVWIMFEAGMADYPVWLGGWWGAPSPAEIETADGRGAAAHTDLPTNNFGGTRRATGMLKMERMPGLSPEDQPNNYTYISPLQKYWELDDRQGLEKVKIADQLDNYFWINTQKGRSTWELIQGLDANVRSRKYRGITLNNEAEVWQAYTYRGWQITIDDKLGFLELSSPTSYKVRIDESAQRLEVWTANGNYLVLSDLNHRIDLRTTAGRRLTLDDTTKQLRFAGIGGNYLLIDENANTVELRSAGDMAVKAVGNMKLAAGGSMHLDAATINLNCGSIDVTSTLGALAAYARPLNAALTTKADYEQRGKIPQ